MKQNATDKVKVGDVFVNTWGYDQTNADFYQVVKKTKKSVVLKAIDSNIEEKGFMCGNATPKKGDFVGDEIRKIPYEYNDDSCLAGNVCVNFEYGCGKLWNEKPVACSWYA